MKVLVACEFSGTVRQAFAARGHDAWSCDLIPSEIPGNHLQGDVLIALNYGWDLMIAHPPCTHLAASGARWFHRKQKEQAEALDFVQKLLNAPIPHIALENPVGVLSTKVRKPDQVIHPWLFGSDEQKATCLWLKNLPPLRLTKLTNGKKQSIHRMGETAYRSRDRSRTCRGIAEAMAAQWSKIN